jgi:hypothetical protein
MIIKYFKDYIDSINEGLIKTYPGELVLKDVLNSLKHMHMNVSGSFENNKIELVIYNFNIIPLNQIRHLFDHIDTFIVNRGGWFPSTMNIIKLTNINKLSKYNFDDIIRIHDEINTLIIEYESKFDTEEIDIPKTLYHLTIKEYCKNINKIGLVPKSKSKLSSHLDRIYLCKTHQDCVDLIPKMMLYYTGEEDENIYKLGKKLFSKDITPVIYEIDNSTNIIDKLYIDINYNQRGYYTLNNIPKDKIKMIDLK